MKKTLLAFALMGSFGALATSVSAAEAQVYGVIDVGLTYTHTDSDLPNKDATDNVAMTNAQEFGSRFGIRGSEDLGNGSKLSFVLENGFQSDTGSLDQNGRLFGREASLTWSGSFGALAAGRLPIFGSVLSANGLFRAVDPLFANYTSAFGSGHVSASMWTRVDNAVSYRSPTVAGFTGYAMYSFKNDSKVDTTSREGMADADRYASLAVRFQQGPVEAVLVADTTMYGNNRHANGNKLSDHDDGVTVTLGGNYTLGNGVKFVGFYQYFEDQELNTNQRGGIEKDTVLEAGGYGFVTGYGFNVGVHVPVAGGVAKAMVGHRDMHNQSNVDFKRTIGAVGYDYNLSKRTAVYAMGGYSYSKIETAGVEYKPTGCEVTVGMVHRF